MSRRLAVGCAAALLANLTFAPAAPADEPSVKVERQVQGSRVLEKSTEAEAIRDYLQAWESMGAALNTNQAALLDPGFVGTARDKLAEAIAEQVKAGVRTRYQAQSHDLQFVFYSPEGQSLELVDTVEYEQQVLAADKNLTTGRVRTRYLVVMTPAEVRWRVRVFQADTGK